MSLKVESAKLPTRIDVPGSKSYANRYLILAARLGNRTIHSLPVGDDVDNMVDALKRVGLKILSNGSTVAITNSFPDCETSDLEIDVGEGGTTARFLAAMLATGKMKYRLHLAGRLAQRPWEELLSALRQAGARASLHDTWVEIQGPVDWSRLPQSIDASRSTQFASALQLAGAKDGVKLIPSRLQSSKAYWDMTLFACQQMASHKEVTVPLDWSSASYPLALAAVSGQVTCLSGLELDPLQADSSFGNWLIQRKAIRFDEVGAHVKELKDLGPTQMDMSQCLDLAPTMAFICAHLQGTSVLSGLEGLIHKESDRLGAITNLLSACGVAVEQGVGSLKIQGGVKRAIRQLHPPADHRLVMVAALFLANDGGGILDHESAVAKSFPKFFEALGFQK